MGLLSNSSFHVNDLKYRGKKSWSVEDVCGTVLNIKKQHEYYFILGSLNVVLTIILCETLLLHL